jgi:shikimate kinase
MSGTGKSTVLQELSRRGFRVADTDEPGWTVWDERDDGYVWREDRLAELLSIHAGTTLYVSGTVSNQGRFYPQFDAIVLLSAPAEILFSRIERRTTNRYGKTPDDQALILRHLGEIEPLLRATCTHEIDTTRPLAEVVERLVEIGEQDDR